MRFKPLQLHVLLVVAALLFYETTGTVIELNVTNFAATIKSKQWTCLLMYDGENNDIHHNSELFRLLQGLDDYFRGSGTTSNSNTGFAQLDIRRHNAYREAYYNKNEEESTSTVHSYYNNFPKHAEEIISIHENSFMKFTTEMYLPSKIVIMAGNSNYNVYGEIDPNHDIVGNLDMKISILTSWLQQTFASKQPSMLEEITLSPIQQEIEKAIHNEDVDNSFPFKTYLKEKEEEENQKSKDEERLLLELSIDKATSNNNNIAVENDDDPTKVINHYQYHSWTMKTYEGSSVVWLDIFATVVNRYLSWIEGYETNSKWDTTRKQKEDETCQFGIHLHTMNEQLQQLIHHIFSDDYISPPQFNKVSSFNRRSEEMKNQIPKQLKPYIEDMIFGYGRSPASMIQYLQTHVKDILGPDATTRKHNVAALTNIIAHHHHHHDDNHNNNSTVAFGMFERMRDYMKIVADTNHNPDLYLYPIADLVSQWYNIMITFHNNLQQSYREYIEKNNPNPEESYQFPRKPVDILDMTDLTNNYDILTNYESFHERYTKTSTPVILSNVNMTNKASTYEYLIEKCGAMDVTNNVRTSDKVGTVPPKGISDGKWAGLEFFIFPETLMNEQRIEDSNDVSLTLQQFITLFQKIDNIYLHDYNLPQNCASILYKETLYDNQQHFRIPSIVASYDLFQRVPLYGYSNSWPSLFIGKKGTNSKMHVDRGASGFFMYLVSGRKRWIITKPTERPFLYQGIVSNNFAADVLGIDKNPDANDFLTRRFPLLHHIEDIYEVVQGPGQLIYVPPDSPHAVENLDDTIGIALNMIPKDAFGNHIHDQIHLDREFGMTELALKYWLFNDMADKPTTPVPLSNTNNNDPLYMTFAEYNAQG